MSPSGSTCPVSFCTRFRDDPGVAWERAIELENPLAQMIHPEYAPATNQPKSIRIRLAISRARSPATTRPHPQLIKEVTITTRIVRTMAARGVFGRDASQSRTKRTGREFDKAYPVTRIRTIWNAKDKIWNSPASQPFRFWGKDPFGANRAASRAVMIVR